MAIGIQKFRFARAGICIVILVFIYLVAEAASEPVPSSHQSSSFAINSNGKGDVTVICDGKMYKGEGAVGCTSVAYRLGTQQYSLCMILGALIYTFSYWYGI